MVNYAKAAWEYKNHVRRYTARVESMPVKLTCQNCGGEGRRVEPVTDDGQGPWEECGWCAGTGLMDPWRRGLWLRLRKAERGQG